jgi:hypothetical protein
MYALPGQGAVLRARPLLPQEAGMECWEFRLADRFPGPKYRQCGSKVPLNEACVCIGWHKWNSWDQCLVGKAEGSEGWGLGIGIRCISACSLVGPANHGL